jgi:glycosyltransferase involved in cell wall biosynthesis
LIRILRLITRLNVGGPARHVVWLASALNDGDFRTTLVTGSVPPGEADMSWFAAKNGVEPVVVEEMSREISPADLITLWKVYRLLVRERPDVVHTHTAKAGTIGRLAGLLYRFATPAALIGRPRRCRFIHTYHGHIFHSYYGRAKTKLFLTIERMLARLNTSRIVVLSEQQLGEIHERFRVGRPAQFAVVPLGIDLDEVRAERAARERLRRELGIAAEATVVGTVGRLTAIKNHDLFLRVAAHVSGDARFVLFGDGADRELLERRAQELGANDRVVFAGTREPREIYAAVDVVALTSLNEGTPLALIEAMANGLPIVSTAVGGVIDLLGGVRERVSDGATSYDIRERGLTVASQDEASFVAGLARITADAALAAALGRDARAYVQRVYSKERLIDDIARVTRELVR